MNSGTSSHSLFGRGDVIKLLAVLICAIAATTVFTVALQSDNANAESQQQMSDATSGTTGDYEWHIEGDTLYIEGSGTMADYSPSTGNYAPWGTAIRHVILSENLHYIGAYAFYHCYALSTIEFEGQSSSASIDFHDVSLTIGHNAFEGCISLSDIILANSFVNIGEYAFYGCTGLGCLEVYATIGDIGQYAFSGSGLTSVNFIGDTGSGVFSYYTVRDHAFSDCNGLEKIYIDYSRIVFMYSYVFSGCSSLTDIEVIDSTWGVGEYTFAGCTALKNVKLDDVYSIVGCYAFAGCTSLESFCICGSTFCLHDYTFAGCTSLNSFVVSNCDVVDLGNYAFYNCTSLCKLDIDLAVVYLGVHDFDGAAIQEFCISRSDLFAEDYAFAGCTSLERFVIHDSFGTIGRYAFAGCTGLKEIEIAYTSLDIADHAFYGCTGLVSLTVVGNSYVSFADHAFYGCTSLQDIDLVCTYIAIGDYAFYGCTSLENIRFLVGESYIGDYAFAGCTHLKQIDLSGTRYIGGHAFDGCSSLESVTFGKDLAFIGEYAFRGTCIKEIIIPAAVETVEQFAFSNIATLRTIVIDCYAGALGSNLFNGCTSVTKVVLGDNVNDWGSVFNGMGKTFVNSDGSLIDGPLCAGTYSGDRDLVYQGGTIIGPIFTAIVKIVIRV